MQASTTAKRALEAAKKDPKGTARLAIYHDLVSQCDEALGSMVEALTSAETARDLASDDKYRGQLAARVEALKERQG